jgi:hypothetical protein
MAFEVALPQVQGGQRNQVGNGAEQAEAEQGNGNQRAGGDAEKGLDHCEWMSCWTDEILFSARTPFRRRAATLSRHCGCRARPDPFRRFSAAAGVLVVLGLGGFFDRCVRPVGVRRAISYSRWVETLTMPRHRCRSVEAVL